VSTGGAERRPLPDGTSARTDQLDEHVSSDPQLEPRYVEGRSALPPRARHGSLPIPHADANGAVLPREIEKKGKALPRFRASVLLHGSGASNVSTGQLHDDSARRVRSRAAGCIPAGGLARSARIDVPLPGGNAPAQGSRRPETAIRMSSRRCP
jgi:hypothetical protein